MCPCVPGRSPGFRFDDLIVTIANLPSVQMKPVDICALKPVTVALPQRILTALPFHPNCELFVCSSGTGDALFNYMEGYVAESVESNVITGEF